MTAPPITFLSHLAARPSTAWKCRIAKGIHRGKNSPFQEEMSGRHGDGGVLPWPRIGWLPSWEVKYKINWLACWAHFSSMASFCPKCYLASLILGCRFVWIATGQPSTCAPWKYFVKTFPTPPSIHTFIMIRLVGRVFAEVWSAPAPRPPPAIGVDVQPTMQYLGLLNPV